MSVTIPQLSQYIRSFAFEPLFNELGWDHYHVPLEVTVNGDHFTLQPVAHKRGLVVFHCPAIPENRLRRKIEQQVAKSHRENIIVYTDADQTEQVWQWVRREPGKPLANRERHFHKGHTGENLAQTLRDIAFSLEEEDRLSIVDVTGHVRATFDVETRIAKPFYNRFKREHDAFMGFIDGIPDDDLHRWYASVMLNRLMFIYFVQEKGFLDGDKDYLRNHLKRIGSGNYYRDFLCPLFFAGFAAKEAERSTQICALLGDVPYLNGGLFLKHQIEQAHGEKIQIANQAFEKLFDFFEDYRWHLDERPLREDNEINPDVLGYIFEKYINQKQMGAYYTKEDITEYIGKNTIIPFLFDEARKAVRIAFEGDHTIWDLLSQNPDRYIYDAVSKGLTWTTDGEGKRQPLAEPLPLPAHIAAGLDNVFLRGDWNTPAPPEYALPTEIWREVAARRQRYAEVRGKLAAGEVRQINDLITLNLDIQQFAQDVLNYTDGPDVVRALWKALNRVTVLDPTCGSGAFLFAALNILEPLYEACLDRMKEFVAELERTGDAHPQKYSDFRAVLEQNEKHRNRRYFILKCIVVNNLFGVDIMEEAVEICKLRLFLKLVAQVDATQKPEPLPDIDFNIRAGNALVGFATKEQVKQALEFDITKSSGGEAQMKMLSSEDKEALDAIEEKAQAVDSLFRRFREQQTTYNGEVHKEDKQALRARLDVLADELNRLLAIRYGIDSAKPAQYESWLKSHQPFHWFAEFYGVLSSSGFDVVIGNPPYVEYSKISDIYDIVDYKTKTTGNLYAFVIERSLQLSGRNDRTGMIIPLSAFCTNRMSPLWNTICEKQNARWLSHFGWRPAKLFSGVNLRLSILLLGRADYETTLTTQYYKWNEHTRNQLFEKVAYVSAHQKTLERQIVPKIQTLLEHRILDKVLNQPITLAHLSTTSANKYPVFYKNTGVNHWITATTEPPKAFRDGKLTQSSRQTSYDTRDNITRDAVMACINSGIFFWFYTVHTNCRDLNPSDIKSFPVPPNIEAVEALKTLASQLMENLDKHSAFITRNQRQTGTLDLQSFKPRYAKEIIDEIDRVLARHYGFTDEELDFIINYDIKYRMGNGLSGDEDDA